MSNNETNIIETEKEVDTTKFIDMFKEAIDDTEDIVQEEITEDFAENPFQSALQDYEKFDERAKAKGEGYKIPNYPLMEKHLEGVESGLYLFSGESNSGKSALMMNILKDMASYRPNKLYGVYYSLDDDKNEIIPRIIAMEQEIPISVASKPKRYENFIERGEGDNLAIYQEYLNKREQGLAKLKSEVDLFKVEDTERIKNSTDLKKHISSTLRYIKSIDEEMNLVIAIDAINDIALDKKVFGNLSGNDKMAETAKFVKDMSKEFDIVIFSSTHLRKLNGNRRPTVDDLKEANTLLYEASVVWLVYNDVSKNKAAANVYWEDENVEGKLGAVIEIDWGKNKKSSYKGRTFCKFQPNFSKATEFSKEESLAFESIIYQAN